MNQVWNKAILTENLIKHEKRISDMEDTMKRPNIHLIRIPGEYYRENGENAIFRELLRNF